MQSVRSALRFGVQAHPRGEFVVWQFTGRHGEGHHDRLGIADGEQAAVQAQEKFQRDEGRPFVTVDEGVILGDAQRVNGGQFGNIRFAVARAVQRPSEGAVEKASVTEAGGASVFRQLFVMDGKNKLV